MKEKEEGNWVRWLARVAGILAMLYIVMFSLDVFAHGAPLGAAFLGFLVHNIPTLLLILILVVAWKWERVGGGLFILVSLAPFLLLSNIFWVNAALAAPFFFTGILFLISAWMESLNEHEKEEAPENPKP